MRDMKKRGSASPFLSYNRAMELSRLINCQRIVILTGAGISAESGLSTFRDQGGLWEKHRIEDVATPEAFERDPKLVYSFYNTRREQLNHVHPNAAHLALAQLEQEFRGEVLLITQNVDDLHDRAGSNNLIHMHGELKKMRCTRTGKIYPIIGDLDANHVCDCCQKPGLLRPHIVWFGEMPLSMERIQSELELCDLFISIGTSGAVYPAAMFVDWAPSDAYKIEMNLDITQVSEAFHQCIVGAASVQVPKLVQELITIS
jgi:NAD-dependent deacetylase